MENKEEIKKDLEKYKDIIILGESAGGKILIDGLKNDIKINMSELGKYQTCTHAELMAIACKIVDRINILRVFTNAKDNAEVLEDLLKEEEKE